MNRTTNRLLIGLGLMGVLTVGAWAQDGPPSAGDNPPPPRGGGFGGPGGFRGGGRGMQGPASLSNTPVPVLVQYLSLTDDQKTKVDAIVAKMQASRPPRPQPSADGGPPSQEEMAALFSKMQAAGKEADTAITAVLTDAQKAKVPSLLKALGSLRVTRVSPAGIAKLKLTDDQITKLAALGTMPQRDKVEAVLTADQLAIVKANQQQGRGGRGGGPGGGYGGGRPGGGPPPDGGQGAPPPPGDNAPPPPAE